MSLVAALVLPFTAAAEVICALGPGAASYNGYDDQRPTADAMQLAGQVNSALSAMCAPRCPMIPLFRNPTAPNIMLVFANGDAKIVYAPQFLTMLDETYGDGAVIAVVAHELGHAVNETAPSAWIRNDWPPEVRADVWAGCALAKANLTTRSLREALAGVSKYPSPAHPGWTLRLTALRLGYTHCGGAGATFDGAGAQR